MSFSVKITILFVLLSMISCSDSYKKLTESTFTPTNEFSQHLLNAYKEKADFEAKKMHDWNSAKLYSEKALSAAEGIKLFPQKISYWKVSNEKKFELIKAYNNLNTVYEEAITLNPFNLAKAISSLDCWSEQEEESWQTWDIKKCRDDFLNAMHSIYLTIDNFKKHESTKKLEDSALMITKDKKENILQIIYFDFDKSKLTSVNIKEIKNFIKLNKKKINKFLIIGHTDTVGSKNYNQKLSSERAKSVKKILIDSGIDEYNIKILGVGETNGFNTCRRIRDRYYS